MPWSSSLATLGIGLSLISVAPRPLTGQGVTDDVRTERLAAVGRLWAAVKYFHPYLAYRPIDWDSALVAAMPKVQLAPDREAFASAIQGMLAALDDPATRVGARKPPGGRSRRDPDPRAWWTPDSVLLVSLRNYRDLDDYFGTRELMAPVVDSIRRAGKVVFDLRPTTESEDPRLIADIFTDLNLAGFFTSTPLRAPAQRGRFHSGFAPQDGTTSGGYHSGFVTEDGELVMPADTGRARRAAVFLLDRRSQLPASALALREAGRASIVVQGRPSDAPAVRTHRLELPDSLVVTLRLTELVRPDGGLFTDSVLSDSAQAQGDPGLEAALALVRGPRPRRPASGSGYTPADPRPESPYAEMVYSAEPYRLLAAFRIWAVGQYFFPYRHLLEESWDSVLTAFVPRFQGARDSLQYALTVAEMATHLHDSHVGVYSPVLRDYFGAAAPPVFVRIVEGLPVIAHFVDDTAARAAGAEVGDVVLSVEGEAAGSRLRRHERYISASTSQALHRNAALRFLRGPDGSTVRLRVRGRSGAIRTLTLPRRERYSPGAISWGGRVGDMIRILPGNIGYVDLDRLPVRLVDSMFERLKGTRAIIFDMRGYPQGTAWAIAPRLTDEEAPAAARFSRPLATTPDTTEQAVHAFVQQLPRTSGWRYRGRTVMLIDERTQSQAEHTGLFFEAANRTTFIGSPTAGANGDVTSVVLPGGMSMSFTGHDVRHVDGRQLQRIGLVPDVRVHATVRGIRAGRDEVLERAVRWLGSR